MCYIVFISHSLHRRYIKIVLQEYVIKDFTDLETGFIPTDKTHAYAFVSLKVMISSNRFIAEKKTSFPELFHYIAFTCFNRGRSRTELN